MPRTEPTYERLTFYTNRKKEFQDFIKELELTNENVDTAEKREIHDAILREAMSHPDRWIARLDGEDK